MSLDKLTLQEIDQLDDSKKREALLNLGQRRDYETYDFLRRYVPTNLRHQALISMANIDYGSTLDIVLSLIKKEGKAILETLSCIFFDRINSAGKKEFLEEIKQFAELDQETREAFYKALEEGIDLTDIEDTRTYLSRVKEQLKF